MANHASAVTSPSAVRESGRNAVSSTWRALRHRNFQLFFGGQLISMTGTWMQSVAQSWLVYRMTRSSAILGLASFFSQIAVFLLAPIGGAVADRVTRHRIVVWPQTGAMFPACGR